MCVGKLQETTMDHGSGMNFEHGTWGESKRKAATGSLRAQRHATTDWREHCHVDYPLNARCSSLLGKDINTMSQGTVLSKRSKMLLAKLGFPFSLYVKPIETTLLKGLMANAA